MMVIGKKYASDVYSLIDTEIIDDHGLYVMIIRDFEKNYLMKNYYLFGNLLLVESHQKEKVTLDTKVIESVEVFFGETIAVIPSQQFFWRREWDLAIKTSKENAIMLKLANPETVVLSYE